MGQRVGEELLSVLFLFVNFIFIYFLGSRGLLCRCAGLTSAMRRLLIVVASLVAEDGL